MEQLGEQFAWLQQCLVMDEYVLWRGRPVQGRIFTGRDVFMIPFSIMWGGFAIFWELSVTLSGAPVFFRLWGIPFVLVGLYMMVGRFCVQAYILKRTFYAITSRRVLQCRCGRIVSLNTDRLPEVHMTVHKDGSGTLAFDRYGRGNFRYAWGNGVFADASGKAGMVDPVLENIPDVNRVYRILMGQEPASGLVTPGNTWMEGKKQ